MKTLTLFPCTNGPTQKSNIQSNQNKQEECVYIKRKKKKNTTIFIIKGKVNAKYHRLGWQVGLELGSNNATVSVRPSDLAPDAAVMRAVLLDLGLVDVGHPLPAVPLNFLLGVHTLDLDQRCVWVLIRLRSIEHIKTPHQLIISK